jgi:hypothetical protein
MVVLSFRAITSRVQRLDLLRLATPEISNVDARLSAGQ